MKNIIDVTLTAEQQAAMTTAVAALAPAMSFLRTFSPAQRLAMIRVGPRRQSFARLALEGARQHADYLPPSISVAAMERDLALFDALTPVRTQLEVLLQQVKDTQQAASHDACEAGLEVYRALRGHAREAGLDAMVAELGVTLRSRPVVATEPEGTPAP
jgi:hypothetical protein